MTSKKPWFDEYCRNDRRKIDAYAPQQNILDDKWYHTIHFPNGTTSKGVYDMSCSLSSCFFEDVVGKTVLDVGAADGYYSLEMQKRGANVTSLEVHPHLIRHIDHVMRSHGFDSNIIECDVFSQDFLDIDRLYDVIFCSHVLCHVMERPNLNIGKSQFIDRLKTKLSRGGSLISTAESFEKQLLIDKFKFHDMKSYDLNQHGIRAVTVLKLWD